MLDRGFEFRLKYISDSLLRSFKSQGRESGCWIAGLSSG